MFKKIQDRFQKWQRRRKTIRELSMLTDRELLDLGVTRADIPFICR